jgi:hypothetical protein
MNLTEYQEQGFSSIKGWCDPGLFRALALFDNMPINKTGGCLEIGVHHGKFFILLNQYSTATSYAVDVFDDQFLNIDSSGRGSRAAFEENLKRCDLHGGQSTSIIKGDSCDSSLNLVSRIGAGTMRFISIDGGHTVEHTINDLVLSQQLINNQGVVILDDILNSHWLGVIEGVGEFLRTRPTLVPFGIGYNKLYLCKISYHADYLMQMKTSGDYTKTVKFYGWDCAVLNWQDGTQSKD